MLSTTFDLITMAASNSNLVFCFCNIIIVILIAGTPKTASHSDEDTTFAATSPPVDHENKKYVVQTSNFSSFDQNALSADRENKKYVVETSDFSSFDQNALSVDRENKKYVVETSDFSSFDQNALSADRENKKYVVETSDFSSSDQNALSVDRENKKYVVETSDFNSSDQNALILVKKAPSIKKGSVVKCKVNKVPIIEKVLVHDNQLKVEEEEDDELRIRVEEFIQKINRGWRAEKLRPLL